MDLSPDDSHLSTEDLESVRAASAALHQQGWRKEFTIEEMIGKWAWLVAQVERGYPDLVDEYTNDLYCRDWLAKAWPQVTHPVRSCWHEMLQPLDERFRAATIEDGGQAVGRYHQITPNMGWWWHRRPKKLVGDLAKALRTAEETP
ncbi:hypothetical protein ACIBTW_20095 [Micromonospora parva]|uniref:hypothetical protein n=1 Tax=Micromonospora parva TaxID=1464048 RepID=UPI0037BDB1E9